jgi:hypothetical protein
MTMSEPAVRIAHRTHYPAALAVRREAEEEWR